MNKVLLETEKNRASPCSLFPGGSDGKESAQSLGQEDPLEKGMATHSSIPAWRIPMDRGAWWATVHVIAKSWT